MIKGFRCLVVTSWVGAILVVMPPVLAETRRGEEQSPAELPAIAVPLQSEAEPVVSSDREPIAPPVDEPVTQTAQAPVIEITTIQLDETSSGVILRLETTGELQVPTPTIAGNAAIVDIPNAVLQLADDEEWLRSDPAPGIALMTVTRLPDNRVRLAITGTDAPPEIEAQTTTFSITVQVTPGTPVAQTQEEEAIQIIVEGQTNDYRVSDGSTATRTDTPLLDIPASIQVIPRQVLEDQQVLRLDEALNNVSSVTAAGTFGNTNLNFNIRGFDNAPVLQDGFRDFGGYEGTSPETANLERIEVLRGPASILYGEVQPGGVINLVREQPSAEPFYQAELLAGNRGLFQSAIDLSGPLTPDRRWQYRLNALYRRDEGFTDFDQEYERFFVAPVIRWQISDRTELTAYVDYTNEQAPLDNGLVALGNEVIDSPAERIIGEPDDVADSEFLSLGYDLEHRFSDRWRLRNAFRYTNRDLQDFGAIPFAVDEATGVLTRFAAEQELDTENYSLQTNVVGEFTTGSIDHTVLVGVDLNRTNDRDFTRFDTVTPLPLNLFDPTYGALEGVDPNRLPLAFHTVNQTDRLGIYVQDQIELLDNLILLAGIRYDTVDQTTTNYPTNFDPNRSIVTQQDQAWTPRVGIVYQPLPNTSLYASYSQSFTPNIATSSTGDPLEPERGEGFEVGVKAEFLDGDLLATLAYFDIARRNVAAPDPNDPFSSVATGEQRSRGVELDVIGEILPGWNVIASYAYIDAEVTEDTLIAEGNRLFNVPEHGASLWTTYEIQRGNLQGLGFGIGFDFVGERQGDLANSFEVDSYFLTNGAIYYRRDRWRLALNIKNLLDVDYITATQNSRINGIEPGAPLTVVGSISIEF